MTNEELLEDIRYEIYKMNVIRFKKQNNNQISEEQNQDIKKYADSLSKQDLLLYRLKSISGRTSNTKAITNREDIKNKNDYFERFGESLFGKGIGGESEFKRAFPNMEADESETGVIVKDKFSYPRLHNRRGQ